MKYNSTSSGMEEYYDPLPPVEYGQDAGMEQYYEPM